MRLINTTTHELHEFMDDVPYYAILSHRWEQEEVSFQDFQQGKGPSMKGWEKIVGCCVKAKANGWQYAWVDSCCIDKTSSAELSEAINSMFAWYQRAEVCYVYLSDVESDQSLTDGFCKSKWWSRGWTLQELLAPKHVDFFSSSWKFIGNRSNLGSTVAAASGISLHYLSEHQSASIAQKMSWAAHRVTTRAEDQAYCLLGLFNIYMPPLYGEGSNAFQRLQLELLKETDDDSIFAWDVEAPDHGTFGLLAPSPYWFRNARQIGLWTKRHDEARPPITMTSKGIRIETQLGRTHQTVAEAAASSAEPPHMSQSSESDIIWSKGQCLMTLNCGEFVTNQLDDDSLPPRFVQLSLRLCFPEGDPRGRAARSLRLHRQGQLHRTYHLPRSRTAERIVLFAESNSLDTSFRNRPRNLQIEFDASFPFAITKTTVVGCISKLEETAPNCFTLPGLLFETVAILHLRRVATDGDTNLVMIFVARTYTIRILPLPPDGDLSELMKIPVGERSALEKPLKTHQVSDGVAVITMFNKRQLEGRSFWVGTVWML